MGIKEFVWEKATDAKQGAKALAKATGAKKNKALLDMASAIREKAEVLKAENAKDIEFAKSKGLSDALIDRLALTDKTIEQMAAGLEEVALLPDPVGEITRMQKRPNGMTVGRMRVPIGVIAIIYESRPNVTADAAGLCIKAGNAVLLRGGSEAINSNRAIVNILKDALRANGLHEGAVSFLDTPDREAVNEMIKLEGVVDLVIPRGGEGLIRAVVQNSHVPVLKHYKGVCHVFVDRDADFEMAKRICLNAKIQRPGTCNAMETMLVDEPIAKDFIPMMLKELSDMGVKIKACEKTRALYPSAEVASEDDYFNEYLDLVLNVKVVNGMDEAMEHIERYGSDHTEAIVTRDYARAMRFLREVDASSVHINASTRLNDGQQFGLGAEIGISTDKIHARGPMGLKELTCTKFIVLGDGQVRE